MAYLRIDHHLPHRTISITSASFQYICIADHHCLTTQHVSLQEAVTLSLTSPAAIPNVPSDAIKVSGGTLSKITLAGNKDGLLWDVALVATEGNGIMRVQAAGFQISNTKMAETSNEITIAIDTQGPQVS